MLFYLSHIQYNASYIRNSRSGNSVPARSACHNAFANTHEAIHSALEARPALRRFTKALWQADLASEILQIPGNYWSGIVKLTFHRASK